jgi:hypothetical protein
MPRDKKTSEIIIRSNSQQIAKHINTFDHIIDNLRNQHHYKREK